MGSVPPESVHWQLVNAKRCRWCGSPTLRRFAGEVAVHFPGLKNIDKPPVFVFSELSVCIVCGITQFVVPEAKLRLLVRPDPASV
jgi:hypothetical protein